MLKPAHLCVLLVSMGLAASTHGENVNEAAARLDAALLSSIEQAQLKSQPSAQAEPIILPPLADDATFLRRACIDIAGRLPTEAEVSDFLQSKQNGKREALIDRLALSPEAADWRYARIADVLRVTDKVGTHSLQPFAKWLRASIRKNMPWDALVRRILLATGDQSNDPATGLLLRDLGNRPLTASVLAETLLGAPTHCAQCHDHPFSNWTQMQMLQLAACLPPVRFAQPVKATSSKPKKTLLPGARPFGKPPPPPAPPALPPDNAKGEGQWFGISEGPSDQLPGFRLPANYMYVDGKPGTVIGPRMVTLERPLGARMPRSGPQQQMTHMTREQVADAFSRVQREAFARTMAMRIWTWMFGLGADTNDLREGDADLTELHNEWAHSCSYGLSKTDRLITMLVSPFAQSLAAEFIRCGYDLREFQRIIAHTAAYQRQAMASPLPSQAVQITASPIVRRLPAEVLWDAMNTWLPKPLRNLSSDLPEVVGRDHPLRLLGRSEREFPEGNAPLISPGIARFLCNGDLTHRCEESLANSTGSNEVLFMAILGRPPTDQEMLSTKLMSATKADVAWALINTTEFLFQH